MRSGFCCLIRWDGWIRKAKRWFLSEKGLVGPHAIFDPAMLRSALAFSLPGEPPDARVLMHRLGEAILPSTGPLTGLPLDGLEERVLEISDCLDSGADLEVRLGQRIQELLEFYLADTSDEFREGLIRFTLSKVEVRQQGECIGNAF